MEKTQLQEKVQKHVDSLFLTLSQNLDVQVSEDVKIGLLIGCLKKHSMFC